MTIALDLVPEWPDHLAVAEVAALTHIDIAAGEFERRVRPHAFDLLDRIVEIEERGDLDDAADRHHQKGTNEKKRGVLLDDRVSVHQAHFWLLLCRLESGNGARQRLLLALVAE